MHDRDNNERISEVETPEVIELVEEKASITKRWRDEGGVRLQTVTRTEHESHPVSLLREQANIERVKIGRVIEAIPEVREEGDVTVIPVVEERAVIRTELVLVEEIRVSRSSHVEKTEIPVDLRKQEVIETELVPEDDVLPENNN